MRRRRRRAPGTRFIITAIFIGFAIELYTGALSNPMRLARLGAIVREWIFEDGEYWRLVSAMFLHGNGVHAGIAVAHLLVNVWAVLQIGTLFELMFGTRRYLFLYFASGIAASLTSAWVHGGPSVGASGAVFGLLGAFVATVYRSPYWRHHRSARGIVHQFIFLILANLAISARLPMIDMSAHLGGLIAGAVLALVLPRHAPPPPPPPSTVVIDVIPSVAEPDGGRGERRADH